MITDTDATDAGRALLIAGVGNIFLSDDGFGPEVVRRLHAGPLPDGVEAADYGVGGIHLVYDLLDGCETLVLVDAMPRGGRPGDVYVVEAGDEPASGVALDAHGMDPGAVFASLRRLGGRVPRTLVIGCEPATTEERIGLSPVVAGAVDVAVAAVHDLVADELGGAAATAPPTGAF